MMKKIILLFTICFMTIQLFAQRTKVVNVPKGVRDSLTKMFPALQKVKWDKEPVGYEANFEWRGRKRSVVFDTAGNWQEKEVMISQKDFPPAGLNYIREHFPGTKTQAYSKITARDGKKTFEATVKGEDYIFDDAGNFIKTVKD